MYVRVYVLKNVNVRKREKRVRGRVVINWARIMENWGKLCACYGRMYVRVYGLKNVNVRKREKTGRADVL